MLNHSDFTPLITSCGLVFKCRQKLYQAETAPATAGEFPQAGSVA